MLIPLAIGMLLLDSMENVAVQVKWFYVNLADDRPNGKW